MKFKARAEKGKTDALLYFPHNKSPSQYLLGVGLTSVRAHVRPCSLDPPPSFESYICVFYQVQPKKKVTNIFPFIAHFCNFKSEVLLWDTFKYKN